MILEGPRHPALPSSYTAVWFRGVIDQTRWPRTPASRTVPLHWRRRDLLANNNLQTNFGFLDCLNKKKGFYDPSAIPNYQHEKESHEAGICVLCFVSFGGFVGVFVVVFCFCSTAGRLAFVSP